MDEDSFTQDVLRKHKPRTNTKVRRRQSKMPEPLAFHDDFLSVGDCWLTEISNALVVPSQGYQWQNLADELGYSYKEMIEDLESRQRNMGINPVYELLRIWGRREASTFRVLQTALRALGRDDVSRVLDEAIKGEFCLECKIWLNDGPNDFTIHTNHTSTLAQALATFLVDHKIKQEEILFISPTKSGFTLDWNTSAAKLRGRELILTVRDFWKLSNLLQSYTKKEEKDTDDTSSTSSNESGTTLCKETPIIHKHYFVFDGCSIGTFNAPLSPGVNISGSFPPGSSNTLPAGSSNTLPAGSSNTLPPGSSNTLPAGSSNTLPPGQNLFFPPNEVKQDDSPHPPALPPRQGRSMNIPVKFVPQNEQKVKKKTLYEQLQLTVPPPKARHPSPNREAHQSSSPNRDAHQSHDGYFGVRHVTSYGWQIPDKEKDQSSNNSRDSDSDDYMNVVGAITFQNDDAGYCDLQGVRPPTDYDRVSSASQHFVNEISQSLEDMCYDNPAWHPKLPSTLPELIRVTKQYRGQDGWYLIYLYMGQVTITVTFLDSLRHFKILQDAKGRVYFDEDDYKSKTLEDLIEVYKFKDLPVKARNPPTPTDDLIDERYPPLRPMLPPKGSHIRLRNYIPVDPRIGF